MRRKSDNDMSYENTTLNLLQSAILMKVSVVKKNDFSNVSFLTDLLNVRKIQNESYLLKYEQKYLKDFCPSLINLF